MKQYLGACSSQGKQKVIGCKRVFKVKLKSDATLERCKVWLVAKCFRQTPGIDYTETFSPVDRHQSIRVILSLAISLGWLLKQLDVHNPFLTGRSLYGTATWIWEFCMSLSCLQPKESTLWTIKQSPRAWYIKLSGCLWGYVNSKADASLFYKHFPGSVIVVLVYVHDITVTGSNEAAIKELLANLRQQFSLKGVGWSLILPWNSGHSTRRVNPFVSREVCEGFAKEGWHAWL